LSFNLPVVTVRPFNTYGPRQSARAVIPTIITQALTGSSIALGNTTPTRDLNYVSDTVAGFIRAAEEPAAIGQVINLGTGNEISVARLAEKILKLMDKDLKIETHDQRIRPDESEVGRLCADNRKAREILGWESKVSLDQGLRNTIDWLRSNHEQYRSNAYVV
jgi:dTDP-glucose 4,6-dehydratase